MIDRRMQQAIDYLAAKNVTYADVRTNINEDLDYFMTDGDLSKYYYEGDGNIGVRVLVDNGWGFACGGIETPKEVAEEALTRARAAARANRRNGVRVRLSPEDVKGEGRWHHKVITDPFSMDHMAIKDHLLAIDERLRAPHVVTRDVQVSFSRLRSHFANTEGADREQVFSRVHANMSVGGLRDGRLVDRSYEGAALTAQGGWGRILGWDLLKNAPRITQELLEMQSAPLCPTGTFDLVLHPSQVYLQVHESCHGMELDRMLGYEIGYAGGSFLRPEHIGNFQYASPIVSIRANATYPHGAGTFQWDDEGVRAKDFYLVHQGRFVNALSSRQTVMEAKLPKAMRQSTAAMRAEDDTYPPLIRMTNIYLEPGKDGGLKDIIGATEDGLYLRTNRSWSIDNWRRNFHFGTEVGWRIKDGKLVGMVALPAYEGDTIDFWRSVDMIGSKLSLLGVTNCGKGQPGQAAYCGHPSPPIRVRGMSVMPDTLSSASTGCGTRRRRR